MFKTIVLGRVSALGRPLLFTATFGVLIALAATASAQSFNVDFGSYYGSPNAAYGAAANQVGTWTTISTTGSAVALQNLGGTTSSSLLTVTAQSIDGQASAHTGNENALLDDNFFSQSPALWSVSVTGLTNGFYSLYYYAPSNGAVDTGSFSANGVVAANITGSSLGGATFTQGVDWQVVANVPVAAGTLSLNDLTNPSVPGYTGLAGVQLVYTGLVPTNVPEPSTWAILGAGVAGLGLVGLRSRAGA